MSEIAPPRQLRRYAATNLMKARTILTFLFVLVASVTVRAQENPPPPADDFVPERWKEFISTDGGFKVLMPGVPTAVSQPVDDKPGSAVAHFHTLSTGTAEYVVGYTIFGRDLENLQSSKVTLDGIRDRMLVRESGKLLSEEDVSTAGHPGRATVIEVSDGIFRDRYFLVGNRLYTVTIFTPKVKAQTEAFTEGIRKSQEWVANRFLDSFRLLNK